MTGHLKFERGVFYSFEYLKTQLEETITLAQFLVVLKLDCTGRNRLFQNGIFGDEILAALESHLQRDKAPETARMEVLAHISDVESANKPRKRGRPRKNGAKVHDLA